MSEFKLKSGVTVKNTSRYPDEEVAILTEMAFDVVYVQQNVPIKPYAKIFVRNTSHAYHGHAYVNGSRMTVHIGAPQRFPRPGRYPRYKGDMPEYEVKTYREGLIHILAHEMAHLKGTQGGKAGEFMCEIEAADALDYYRKHQAEIDGKIDRILRRKIESAQSKITRIRDQKALRKSPEFRLEQALRNLNNWERKLKLARTKIGKYRRQISALRRSIDKKQLAAQPEQIAATFTHENINDQRDTAVADADSAPAGGLHNDIHPLR